MKKSRNLEFKSKLTNYFLKTVSAFSNFGDGEILFGVSDHGEYIGVSNPDQLCLDIENKINDSISPKPDYTLSINKSNIENITFLLNQFLASSVYKNIIFCWVMHDQAIIDDIISRMDLRDTAVKTISLIARQDELKNRLEKDIEAGLRKADIIERSLDILPLYEKLNTIKIDTSDKDISEVIDEIKSI